MMIRGRRKLINLHAPMLAAGVGSFLAPTQKSRTLTLEMEPYTEETKPEREYTSEDDFRDLDAVYSYLRHWAAGARLNPKPAMPPGVFVVMPTTCAGYSRSPIAAGRSGDGAPAKR
jgi:hypothetical protein